MPLWNVYCTEGGGRSAEEHSRAMTDTSGWRRALNALERNVSPRVEALVHSEEFPQMTAKWGGSPLAVVERADPQLDEAALLAHSIGKLACFRLPKRAVFADAIPRTPSGKALKRVLRDQFSVEAPE
jgi:acyl-CoA synthetase (AMP-forming)/AMP-acid ligase II